MLSLLVKRCSAALNTPLQGFTSKKKVCRNSYQHPAPGASSICPAYYHRVVYFLNDGDEVITLQLWERERHSRKMRQRQARGKHTDGKEGLKFQRATEAKEGKTQREGVMTEEDTAQREKRKQETEHRIDGKQTLGRKGGWRGIEKQSQEYNKKQITGERESIAKRQRFRRNWRQSTLWTVLADSTQEA